MDNFHINPYQLNEDEWVDTVIALQYRLLLQEKNNKK